MKFPNIVHHFTGLESLSVRLYKYSTALKCDYNLISLSNTLTSLCVPQERPLLEFQTSEGLQTHVLDLSALFPNLISLVTPLGSYRPSHDASLEWVKKLPQNLIELRLNYIWFGPEHIAEIPRSLRQLRVMVAMLYSDKPDWNFPPGLRHLSLPCKLPCADFEKYLPLQLETLVLDPKVERDRPNTQFRNLPRSLKVLENACARITNSTCFDGLPKGLERLTIGCASVSTTDGVYPACLKEIFGTSTLSASDSVDFISALPSGVEAIDEKLLST